MRILLLTQFYPPIIGGEERHVRNLAAALAKRGHSVAVATQWYPGADEDGTEGDVRIYRLRGTMQRFSGLFRENQRRHAPPFPDPELLLGLKRVMDREQPDVVHAHNWIVHSYLPLKAILGVPLVVTLHDYGLLCPNKNLMHAGTPCDGPGLGKCLDCATTHYGPVKGVVAALGNSLSGALVRKSADRFIAVSGAVARMNRLDSGPAPFEVVHNFIADDTAVLEDLTDPRLNDLPAGGYILFVGDLSPSKGVNVLIEAYGKLKEAPPLVLIGRPCADLPQTLPANVRVLHNWPHAAIMHAWSRCLFGVAPSLWHEACATVVIEAMALGKPMVVTDVGGMPELVDHERSGLIVAPGDSDALAGALRRLIDDPALRRRMAAASLTKVEALKAQAIVSRIESIYRSLTLEIAS